MTLDQRWRQLAKDVGDDVDRLCDTVLAAAARVGFAAVSAEHLDVEAACHAEDRRTAGGRPDLGHLGPRDRAVTLARGELTARVLGVRRRPGRSRSSTATGDDALRSRAITALCELDCHRDERRAEARLAELLAADQRGPAGRRIRDPLQSLVWRLEIEAHRGRGTHVDRRSLPRPIYLDPRTRDPRRSR